MHIFTLIIMAFFMINTFRKAPFKNKLIWQTAFTVFIYLFVNRGYFLESSFLNVDNWQGILILHFAFLVLHNKVAKMTKSALAFSTYLVFTMAVLIIVPVTDVRLVGDGRIEEFLSGTRNYLTTAPFNKLTVFFCGLAILQVVVISSTFKEMEQKDLQELIRVMAIFVKIIICIVAIEYMMKNVLQTGNLYNTIMVRIFGVGTASYNDLALRGESYMLTGLNREGSHLVHSLAIGVCVLFADLKVRVCNKRAWLWIVAAIVVMIMSRAFTVVLALVFFLTLYVIYYINLERTTIIRRGHKIILLLVLVLVSVPLIGTIVTSFISVDGYMMERLLGALDSMEQIFQHQEDYFANLPYLESTTVRLYSVKLAIQNWVKRPLLGIGIATTYCHGPSVLTLCEIGIIGIIFYCKAYYRVIIQSSKYKRAIVLTLVAWLVLSSVSGSSMRMYVGIDGVVALYCMQAALKAGEKKIETIGEGNESVE